VWDDRIVGSNEVIYEEVIYEEVTTLTWVILPHLSTSFSNFLLGPFIDIKPHICGIISKITNNHSLNLPINIIYMTYRCLYGEIMFSHKSIKSRGVRQFL